jgi:hypothetical protein
MCSSELAYTESEVRKETAKDYDDSTYEQRSIQCPCCYHKVILSEV